MKSILNNSHWHTSVYLHGPGAIAGRTVYLSTSLECAASLRVNTKTFSIERARWEVHRGPGGPLSEDISGLEGVEAYLGSGNALREAMRKYGGQALSLVSETVRGIIQAETFLFTERGYPDAESYDSFWEKMYLNSCRYYSNLDRVSRRWADHVAAQKRFGNLFNRFKSVSVAGEDDSLKCCASLSDSFHEVGLRLTVNKSLGTITAADCSLLRGPDPVCFESGSYADNLLGQKPSDMSKKDIAAAMGGSQGCVHMIDLISDVAAVLRDLKQNTAAG